VQVPPPQQQGMHAADNKEGKKEDKQ